MLSLKNNEHVELLFETFCRLAELWDPLNGFAAECIVTGNRVYLEIYMMMNMYVRYIERTSVHHRGHILPTRYNESLPLSLNQKIFHAVGTYINMLHLDDPDLRRIARAFVPFGKEDFARSPHPYENIEDSLRTLFSLSFLSKYREKITMDSEPIDPSWNPANGDENEDRPIWVDGILHSKKGIKRARNFLVSLRVTHDPMFLILFVLKELDFIGADYSECEPDWFMDPCSSLMSWITPRSVITKCCSYVCFTTFLFILNAFLFLLKHISIFCLYAFLFLLNCIFIRT
jgi:hypothetical protein